MGPQPLSCNGVVCHLTAIQPSYGPPLLPFPPGPFRAKCWLSGCGEFAWRVTLTSKVWNLHTDPSTSLSCPCRSSAAAGPRLSQLTSGTSGTLPQTPTHCTLSWHLAEGRPIAARGWMISLSISVCRLLNRAVPHGSVLHSWLKKQPQRTSVPTPPLSSPSQVINQLSSLQILQPMSTSGRCNSLCRRRQVACRVPKRWVLCRIPNLGQVTKWPTSSSWAGSWSGTGWRKWSCYIVGTVWPWAS